MLKVSDRVRDKDYYATGIIVALYGRWAWVIIDGDPPGARPVSCQLASLEKIEERKIEKQAAA